MTANDDKTKLNHTSQNTNELSWGQKGTRPVHTIGAKILQRLQLCVILHAQLNLKLFSQEKHSFDFGQFV